MISFSMSSSGRTSPVEVSIAIVPAAGSGAIGISLPETRPGTVECEPGPMTSGSTGWCPASGAVIDCAAACGEIGDVELVGIAHHDRTIDRVLELAYVAG